MAAHCTFVGVTPRARKRFDKLGVLNPHPGDPMPSFGGPSRSSSVSNRPELERELTTLESEVRSLEAQVSSLPPASKANTQSEIDRKKSRISEIRHKLGR